MARLAGIAFLVIVASALSVRGAQDSTPQAPVFRAGTETVAIYATALDRAGEMVPNLQREDFDVYDDGKRQPLTVFVERPAADHGRAARGHEREHDAQSRTRAAGRGAVRHPHAAGRPRARRLLQRSRRSQPGFHDGPRPAAEVAARRPPHRQPDQAVGRDRSDDDVTRATGRTPDRPPADRRHGHRQPRDRRRRSSSGPAGTS